MSNREGNDMADFEARIKQLSEDELRALVVTLNLQPAEWQPELKVIMDELAARKNKNRGA